MTNEVEGGCKSTKCCKRRTKCVANVPIYTDRYGKFVIVKGLVFRLGKKRVNHRRLKKILREHAPDLLQNHIPTPPVSQTTPQAPASSLYQKESTPVGDTASIIDLDNNNLNQGQTTQQVYHETSTEGDEKIPEGTPQERKTSDGFYIFNPIGQAEGNEDVHVLEPHRGSGKDDDKGMSDAEIDKVMSRYPEYLGTISHDEIKSRILPEIKPKSRFCFIINTDPRNKPGEHWQAFYIDARPEGDHEIDFFDSYADKMDPNLLKDVKLMADKVNSGSYLKLKENMVGLQNSKSSNCGWFCCQFLIDRLRGKPFPEASKFSDVIRGEASVERFKKQHGGFNRYIPSFDEQGGGIGFPTYYTYYPPNIRKYITDEPITSLKVARLPISKGLNTALNIASLGGWQKALNSVGYDKAFHLYFIINNRYRLERNHVITMFPYSPSKDEEIINVPLKPGITIKSLLENTAKQVGPSLQRYDARDNNCQIYILQTLKANGLGNDSVTKFTNQNIEAVVKKLPWYSRWVGSAAKSITDFAHRAQRLVSGNGKRKRRTRKGPRVKAIRRLSNRRSPFIKYKAKPSNRFPWIYHDPNQYYMNNAKPVLARRR